MKVLHQFRRMRWPEFRPDWSSTCREASKAVDVGAAIALTSVTRRFLLDNRCVPSASMQPTFHIGDRLLVDKFRIRQRAPSRGEVITFGTPKAIVRTDANLAGFPPDAVFIKRVVATAGDTVAVRRGRLHINGAVVWEPWVLSPPKYALPRTLVPEGHVYVLGDNRNLSYDSHEWGPLPVELIRGRALCTYWPPPRICGWRAYCGEGRTPRLMERGGVALADAKMRVHGAWQGVVQWGGGRRRGGEGSKTKHSESRFGPLISM